jgi:lipopolysaccharide/colanic/teichoic acid biosynthesis glycosyltransferase
MQTGAALAGAHQWAHGILGHDDFLLQMRHEKRRAERSKLPLSIVVYHLNDDAAGEFEDLLELLRGRKRETDSLGVLGNSVAAVLCPDTGTNGVDTFAQEHDANIKRLGATAVKATYPDHLFEQLTSNEELPSLPAVMLADAPGMPAVEYALKRPIDVVGSLLALCLFAPIMLLTALAIRLTSPGPVIFRQTRVGKGGVSFTFYKFRSMAADSDDGIHRKFVADLIKNDETGKDANAHAMAVGPSIYKIRTDPRVTRVGRIIRKTSIDELPQLFNVLKGDMSLVGPRPPIPYETANYEAWHLRRVLAVRPGITGLWQVDGRSRVTFSDMVRMDLRYVRRCSLTTDLKILFKTVRAVLRCEGAS